MLEQDAARAAAAIARAEPHAKDPAVRAEIRRIKDDFFRHHAAGIYNILTQGCTRPRRLSDLCYAAAERLPALLPTREAIARERGLRRQAAKLGREADQALFAAHILADERAGLHLVHAMLRPLPGAEPALKAFRQSDYLDFGKTILERRDNVGLLTLTNPAVLNAEDDETMEAFETAIDVALLDDRIEACVLRGGEVTHPKYAGRRVFNAGINLTHLYQGQISFIEFIMERDLGLVHKLYRGLWVSQSYHEQFEDYVEKPWLAVVDAFAIGGGCQLLCVMDRVIAEPGAFFSLPASHEGFIPGAANLRLPRLVGIRRARQAMFFDQPFAVDAPGGMLICDEVVPPEEMEEAIDRNTAQMLAAGFVSAVSNRKALRAGQEPLAVFRLYMATYARHQAQCFFDPSLMANLEKNWKPRERGRSAPPPRDDEAQGRY
jgi:thioesterase DpgC